MGSLFARPFTAKRPVVIKTEGIYKIDSFTDVPTKGSRQPSSGSNFENLDILRKDKGVIEIFCDDELQIGRAGKPVANKRGDFVPFDGQYWEVIAKLKHNQGIIEHFNYVAQYAGVIK